MTNEEMMQLMTEMGLHEGGMENWVPDNAWLLVANKAIEIAIKPWADQLDAQRKKFSKYSDIAVGAMQDVRRDERKECAKVCDAIAGEYGTDTDAWYAVRGCAEAIRSRGNT